MFMSAPRRVFLLGATGTIGRATARALVERGHDVVCFVRARGSAGTSLHTPTASRVVTVRVGDVCDATSITRDGFRGEAFDAVVSCMASRTGAPRDAWAIDHAAHLNVLAAAKDAKVPQMVLLSAICVQKPQLAFQQAKLAFERELITSGLTWSIVRPTAYFKSLSGQVARVKAGKPFLVFGNGALTSCKPISDDDLAHYIVDCLDTVAQQNRVLPIGGPGAAMTPLEQGAALFALVRREPRFKHVPVALLNTVIAVLGTVGRVVPLLKEKAEFARIGRYYATESMLVWDEQARRYDANATPSTGRETLTEYYAKLLRGDVSDDRGEHAVF
jgi:divinyl chlorophyllide a 8-vinyl-reductase